METASLVIKVVSTSAKSATRDLDKLTAAGGRSERASDSLARSWKVAGAAIGTAVVGATTAFLKLAESHQNITSRLRLATKGAEEFNKAYSDSYAIAQRTGTALDGVANLYARLAQSSTELGLSQADIAKVTESVTQAFIVSGATAQEASGGIRQLTQAMAGGTLRAEEFNSIIETSPRIVQALADHFGVSFGKVRQLVNDGKISSEQFAQALITQSQAIRSEFDTMPVTIGRAMQEVRTALQAMAGGANDSSGATDKLAQAIRDLARELESQAVRDGFTTVVNGVSELITYGTQAISVLDRLGKVTQGIQNQADAAGRMTNALLTGNRDKLTKALEDYRAASLMIDSGFAATPDTPATPHPGIDFTRGAPLDNKPAPLASDGIKERTKAIKGLTAAELAHKQLMEEIAAHDEVVSDRQRELANEELRRIIDKEEAQERASASIRALLDDMQFEASLIGKSAIEQEKMIALRYAGAEATDEQRRAIGEFVEGMARAREADADARFLEDGARSLFGEVVSGAGRASDALDRFFDNLKRRAADKLFESLMGGFEGMAGGGGWAGFAQGFASAWGGGRAAGGPVMAGQAYVVGENGPEVFSPGQSGRVHPMGAGVGGGLQVVVNNNAPVKVQAREESGVAAPDGTMLRRLVLDIVAEDTATGGRTAQAMRGRFGLRETV